MTCFLVAVAVLLRLLADLISIEPARIFVYPAQFRYFAQIQPFRAISAQKSLRFQGAAVHGPLIVPDTPGQIVPADGLHRNVIHRPGLGLHVDAQADAVPGQLIGDRLLKSTLFICGHFLPVLGQPHHTKQSRLCDLRCAFTEIIKQFRKVLLVC